MSLEFRWYFFFCLKKKCAQKMSATELLSNYHWSGWWEKPKRRQKKNDNSFAGHCSCVVAHIADIWYVTSPSTTSTTCWAVFPFKSLSRVCGRTSSQPFFFLVVVMLEILCVILQSLTGFLISKFFTEFTLVLFFLCFHGILINVHWAILSI